MIFTMPRPARAQDAETNMQVEEAQGLLRDQRYGEAAKLYEELFARSKQSEFLFQAGLAYQRGGDNAKAMARFQQYLAVDAGGKHSAAAYEWIDRLSPDVRGVERQRTAAEKHQQAEAARRAREERYLKERAWLADHPEVTERFRRRQRSRRRVGLIVGGVGVATLAIGIGFAISASSISDNVSSATVWDSAWDDEASAGERNETIANVLIFGGAAVVITGAVLYFRGRGGQPGVPADALQVTPALGPGGAGLQLAGGF